MATLFLFDIDGTLLLSGGAGTRALNRTFKHLHGINDAMDGIRCSGKTDPMIVAEVFSTKLEASPSVRQVHEVITHYEPLLEEELGNDPGFREMPWARNCLDWLSNMNEACLAIATGNISRCAHHKLNRMGVAHYFPVGGYGDDSPVREELVAIARQRGEKHFAGQDRHVDRVVVIGDTPRDIDAARAADCEVIAVTTGFYAHEALQHADTVIDSLAKLPELSLFK